MDLPVTAVQDQGRAGFPRPVRRGREGAAWRRAIHGSRICARKAIEAYGQLGLPHRRIEAWKYTDLRAAARPRSTRSGAYRAACRSTRRTCSKALGAGDRDALPPTVSSSSRASSGPIFRTLPGLKAAGVEAVSLSRALEKPPAWLKDALGTRQSARRRPRTRPQHRAYDRRRRPARAQGRVILDKPSTSSQSRRHGRAGLDRHPQRRALPSTGASATVIESYAASECRSFSGTP